MKSVKQNNLNKICLLVLSCDKYSDMWYIFFDMLFKNWRECPFDIHLISNNKNFNDQRVKVLKTGEDKSWSDTLVSGLNFIENEYKYVFLLMDDAFITFVDHKKILGDIDKFFEEDGNYLTFINEPKHTDSLNASFGSIGTKSKYRATATWALWKIKTLKSVLKSGESAWQFEIDGSKRSNKFKKFYSVYNDRFRFIHGVVKGMWLPTSVKQLKLLGYNIDLSERDQMNYFVYYRLKIYQYFRMIVLLFIPKKLSDLISRYKWSFAR